MYTFFMLKRSHCCLFCPAIESSLESEEGSSGQQMMPEHLNKTLSTKVVTQTGIECVHISNVKCLPPNIGLPTLYSVGMFKCFV